jgi:hypothetical protein
MLYIVFYLLIGVALTWRISYMSRKTGFRQAGITAWIVTIVLWPLFVIWYGLACLLVGAWKQ